jgi:hypothetical protein
MIEPCYHLIFGLRNRPIIENVINKRKVYFCFIIIIYIYIYIYIGPELGFKNWGGQIEKKKFGGSQNYKITKFMDKIN